MDLRDVAANVVHDYPGGAPSLAPRIGKNATTLAHEVHGTGAAKLGLLDSEKITLRTGDMRILEAFALNCGQMIIPLPAVDDGHPDDCMTRLATTAREFGDLCTEVAGDLVDGVITDNELARIDRECGELMASLRTLREALARRNQVGKPQEASR
ncbi:MAG: phage regulatory CII family protein [Limnohabitans sp.]